MVIHYIYGSKYSHSNNEFLVSEGVLVAVSYRINHKLFNIMLGVFLWIDIDELGLWLLRIL